MLTTSQVVTKIDEIKSAVTEARELIDDDKWLSRQSELKPREALLQTDLKVCSQKSLISQIERGIDSRKIMHPVAEAIIGAERIIEHHERSKIMFFANFLYLLTSLRDTSLYVKKIQGAEVRIEKLKTDAWRATLYELLSAASLATRHATRFVPETKTPTPDLCIDDPEMYIECKARSAPSDKTVKFVTAFQQQALGRVVEEIQKIGDGLQVLIEIHDDKIIADVHLALRELFLSKQTFLNNKNLTITITPYKRGPFKLPHPMRFCSAELWLWLMNFKNFEGWHLVLPNAECKISNYSNTLVTEVQKPVLVCVRHSKLKEVSPSLRQLVKTAYGTQLQEPHTPGAIRVLVDVSFFSLVSDIDSVKDDLEALATDLMRECKSRLFAICFDIVRSSQFGDFVADYRSLIVAKQSHAHVFQETPGVLLF